MEYAVRDFVRDLRAADSDAPGDSALVERITPLLARLAQSRRWLRPEHYECDPEQGFRVHVLHEEPGHGPWLVAVSWLPHRGPPPHDHRTGAVIAGVGGEERENVLGGDGARLEPEVTKVVGPGEVIAFPPGAIHSVTNRGDRTTLSLHVYGKNQNHAQRSRFDASTGAEMPFKLNTR